MDYEIIDFHTHPFARSDTNICVYANNGSEHMIPYLKGLGISRICGSVICRPTEEMSPWEALLESNRLALELADQSEGFYIPGFHVHPNYIQESCDEMERMHRMGHRLIGELVPYIHGWQNYSCKAFDEILDAATQLGMVVSFHSINDDAMDDMVRKHPNAILVAAHPGEHQSFQRHLERMKLSENYYLDLSGTGLFRHRMLRHGIDALGAHRFLFGSDYPVCNPAMFVGGIALDSLITPEEKQQIFSGNAKMLLGL